MTAATIGSSDPTDFAKLGFTEPDLMTLFRKMLLIRRFEEKLEDQFVVKKAVRGLSHLSIGQEAVAVGLVSALRPDDLLLSNHRGHGHSLAKGVPPRLMMAEVFGRSTGTCKGIGGSMHAAKYPEVGLVYATAIVGSGIPIAVGMALAAQQQKSGKVIAVCFGDGAANMGSFHEGMNIASLWKLPVVLVCENNEYAMSMKAENFIAGPGIAKRAEAYGMPGVRVDGDDVIAVSLAAKEAVKRAREGGGPTLLECRTYRIKGHGVYDKATYRPQEEVDSWKLKDPIEHLRTSLLQQRIATSEELEAIDAGIRTEIEEAVQFALDSPPMSLDKLGNLVFK